MGAVAFPYKETLDITSRPSVQLTLDWCFISVYQSIYISDTARLCYVKNNMSKYRGRMFLSQAFNAKKSSD